ncbi:hypothetical protein [Lactiplantibacillus plantarum]|uniref:hypothetical protein n=1 Tax=Lactiplantibacillus plantarum TaxID=1590 RepID=UPI000931D8AC|nr:hypothetical protein [Lactiplantibacillus plantarum]
MNLDFKADVHFRKKRVLKEFGYFLRITAIGCFNLILLLLFRLLDMIFDISFETLGFLPTFGISIAMLVSYWKKNGQLRKIVSKYFFYSKRRKRAFVISSAFLMYASLETLAGLLRRPDQLYSDIVGLSAAVVILLSIIMYTAIQRAVRVVLWALFPYLERDETITNVKETRITGANSQYLSHGEIYSYIVLNIVFMFFSLVLVIYICGYITLAFPVTHNFYVQVAAYIKLSANKDFDLMDLIQIVAAFTTYQGFFDLFRNKLCRKINDKL